MMLMLFNEPNEKEPKNSIRREKEEEDDIGKRNEKGEQIKLQTQTYWNIKVKC